MNPLTEDQARQLAMDVWVEKFSSDKDVEIDDDAAVSLVPGQGAWVQAWVWVDEGVER